MAETPAPETSGAARWQARYDAAQAKGQVRDADFTTLSGMEVAPVYGPGRGVISSRTKRLWRRRSRLLCSRPPGGRDLAVIPWCCCSRPQ